MIVIEGIVEQGDQRGRLLGFPTANIPLDSEEVDDGVWGAIVRIEPDRWVPAAVSIGCRRTFYAESGQRVLEAHLLYFNEELYGRRIRVELATKLRPQRTFDTTEALTEQLHQDVQRVLEWSLTHFPAFPSHNRRECSAVARQTLSNAS
ncbi:riboflavin kinase [Pseudarthrobacter enclensis]|uniref:riboflavin kinase n=1 Tax=Pseudarthrobacter enclensis TaxID=993070 RepID=A0ABT9RTV2_9MICC|nr:riboflavin kinase [Pseudarthrobacter enclensis]MDP9888676.1 riboflavin kinase/FMN adenylyltransferase [Pseudarthrobacter enclensis]